MLLWVLSDLHLESTRGWNLAGPGDRPRFDVLVVAGDLIPKMERGVAFLLERVTDKQVIVVHGDGSMGLNAMELDTAIRHKIPILVVISLNGGWTGDPKREKPGRDLGYTRYDKICEALGGYGEYVTKPEDITPALERAQATPYGLSAAIMTNDQDRGLDMALRLDSGIVHVNAPTLVGEPSLPNGGVKDSGWGRSGHYAMEDFTEIKLTTLNHGRPTYPI